MQKTAERLIQVEITDPARTRQIQSVLFPFSGEERILVYLFQMDTAVLSGELMEQTGLTTGRIANLLKQLEKKGLIRRRLDDADRRRVFVFLTEEGKERAEEVRQKAIAQCGKLLYYVGEEDADRMVSVLLRLFRQQD